MLREVGAGGRISLGKKYAGQLFDLQADGSIVVRAAQVVPVPPSVRKPPCAHRADRPASPTLPTSDDGAQPQAGRIARYNARPHGGAFF